MGRTGLSRREHQILELASAGHIDQAIANDLGISVPTVSTYWCRIREKYGRLNRAELVAKFVREREQVIASALRNDNEELVGRLDEAAVREQGLAQELATYEALLEGAPDPMIIVDADGVIQRVNRLAARLFGWDREGMAGIRIGRLMPATLHATHRKYREAYLAAMPGPIQISSDDGVVAVKRDGSPVRVTIHLNATETPSGRMIVCILRPVDDPLRHH